MRKEEFESRIGREVTEDEYGEIEYVYTYHPAISEMEGKDQIASIFNSGGMVVIRSMKEAAVMAELLEREIKSEMRKIDKLKARLRRIEHGDISYERCMNDAKKVSDMAEGKEQLNKMFAAMEIEYGDAMVGDVRHVLDV